MKNAIQAVRNFIVEEDGVTMVEYGLLAALITVVCIAAIVTIGQELNQAFTCIANKLTNPAAGVCP